MTDFPATRAVLDQFDAWLAELAAPILPLEKRPEPKGGFRWAFRNSGPYELLVGKAVRMIGGIRAAMLLADAGFTVETGSLLRTVSDFSQESIAIAEGLITGRLTKSQQKFVDQYYAPIARTPEEFEKQEWERFVTREELLNAHRRLAEQASGDAEQLLKLTRWLNAGYDRYVHGKADTAAELYRGDQSRFMLSGHDSDNHRCVAKSSIAGKTLEVLASLELTAMANGSDAVGLQIRKARLGLMASEEGGGRPCRAPSEHGGTTPPAG